MEIAVQPLGAGGVTEPFRPVAAAFTRLLGRGAGGGALVVRLRGRTVVNLCTGAADVRGTRPWTADTLAISFSTTKGIASAVLHGLADRGELGYDEPVAAYWPEFGVGGKDRVTVRELLTHRAGLYSVRAVADRAEDLLDHLAMEERLAARSARAPTMRSGYHAITYGWLVSGLVRRVTGLGLAELVRSELAEPLGTNGLHIGAPADIRPRVAEPVGSALRHLGSAARVLAPLWTRSMVTRASYEALHLPGFHRLFEGAEPPIWTTEMPAVNGTFSAEGLARLYGALANGGSDEGATLLSPATTHELGRVQLRSADAVLGLRMRWRLGYHQAFGAGGVAPRAFGHYGYGGSGGWADPTLGLSLGFVTNRIGSVSTPLGDLTLFRLNRVVRECAARAGL
jgi:CubicO group peptidase (beta-lactamase class C family)